MTKLVLAFIGGGALVGYFGVRNQPFEEMIFQQSGYAVTIGLCLLLLFVGISVGLEGGIGGIIKRGGIKLVLFPIVGMVGTLIGAAVVAIPLGLSFQESMAIGAGFGWYTLAPNLIMAYSAKLSAVSFIYNLLRVLGGIILIPIVAKRIGFIECTVIPGVPAADLCLPIVERSTNSSIAVYSLMAGLTMSITVPILTNLFLGI